MDRGLVRPMTPEDLPALEPLVAGRNVHPSELARFLSLEGAHALVLEHEGRILAAITALRWFDHGFVGPVLAAPGAVGAGVQVVLVARALEGLQKSGVSFIEAEATEEEARLLEALGFRRTRDTLVLERAPAVSRGSGRSRAMTKADLLDVGALDAEAAGHGRKELIASLMLDGVARVTESEDAVTGFATMRRSRRGYLIGPLVTRHGDAEAAEALLLDVVAEAGAFPVVALSPEGSALAPALARAGFEQVARLVRMRVGDRAPPAPEAATEWLAGGRMTG